MIHFPVICKLVGGGIHWRHLFPCKRDSGSSARAATDPPCTHPPAAPNTSLPGYLPRTTLTPWRTRSSHLSSLNGSLPSSRKEKSLSEHELALALPRPESRRPAGEMHTGRVGHLLVAWALNHPDDKCVRWFSRVFTWQLLPHFPNKRNTCGLSQTPSPSVFDRAHTTNG